MPHRLEGFHNHLKHTNPRRKGANSDGTAKLGHGVKEVVQLVNQNWLHVQLIFQETRNLSS